jgi:hypothetical protein
MRIHILDNSVSEGMPSFLLDGMIEAKVVPKTVNPAAAPQTSRQMLVVAVLAGVLTRPLLSESQTSAENGLSLFRQMTQVSTRLG